VSGSRRTGRAKNPKERTASRCCGIPTNVKLLKVKTARFAEVIEKCGKPEVYTLWQKPSADRHLQSQIKNNRLMTVQKSETGTEFGMVGFKERKGASHLIFPKSLKRFENQRIIGINWELVK